MKFPLFYFLVLLYNINREKSIIFIFIIFYIGFSTVRTFIYIASRPKDRKIFKNFLFKESEILLTFVPPCVIIYSVK